MKIASGSGNLKGLKADSLVKFCFDDGLKKDKTLGVLDKELNGAITAIYRSGEFEGKQNQSVVVHAGDRMPFSRVILAGIGSPVDADNDRFRQASGTISRLTAIQKSKAVAIMMDDAADESRGAAVIEGFLLGGYKMDDYRTGSGKEKNYPESIIMYREGKGGKRDVLNGAERGQVIAEGVINARRMAAHPANYLTPVRFASEAKALSRKHGFSCTVLDESTLKKEKMGLLLAVARGSVNRPRFLVLKYNKAKTKNSRPIVLVGKGVTFDSGGLSLKDRSKMVEMKGDMQGGAIVLSTVMTAARLGLPINLVGLIPLVENMPSGNAYRPDDIITSRKGKTVEIISTDAEGRLILADALDYANKFKPQAVIDIATLTGAALYILGYAGIPIMGNNASLMDALKAASGVTAERVWELPIWDEHREAMKSPLADLKNSGGQPAPTITAAAFLENFIGGWPWAHIDIAYVDVEKSGRPYIPKGTTGNGLRLLVEFLSNWKMK